MEFNVGDRVMCIGIQDGNEDILERLGTIIYADPDFLSDRLVTVEFDQPFRRGHRGTARNGLNGYCWDFAGNLESKLSRIDEYPLPSLDELF